MIRRLQLLQRRVRLARRFAKPGSSLTEPF
jgi:hypothetical protein